jgi:hypothetical protein
LEQLRAMLFSVADAGSGIDQCRALFEHVAEYRDIQLALAGGRGEVIVDAALTAVLDQTLRRSLASPENSQVPRDLIIAHIVATLHTVLRWWLRQGNERASAAEADAIFRKLLLSGIPEEWQPALRERFVAVEPS